MQRPSLGLSGRDNDSADRLMIINKELTSWLFERDYDQIEVGSSTRVVFNADYLDSPVPTENVLGLLKGSEKPDEIIVITSHYDHVGIIDGEIHNGADDDGSGTVTVLEIAEAFSQAAAKSTTFPSNTTAIYQTSFEFLAVNFHHGGPKESQPQQTFYGARNQKCHPSRGKCSRIRQCLCCAYQS